MGSLDTKKSIFIWSYHRSFGAIPWAHNSGINQSQNLRQANVWSFMPMVSNYEISYDCIVLSFDHSLSLMHKRLRNYLYCRFGLDRLALSKAQYGFFIHLRFLLMIASLLSCKRSLDCIFKSLDVSHLYYYCLMKYPDNKTEI